METLTLTLRTDITACVFSLSRSLTEESVVAISFDENSTGKTFSDTKVHPGGLHLEKWSSMNLATLI